MKKPSPLFFLITGLLIFIIGIVLTEINDQKQRQKSKALYERVDSTIAENKRQIEKFTVSDSVSIVRGYSIETDPPNHTLGIDPDGGTFEMYYVYWSIDTDSTAMDAFNRFLAHPKGKLLYPQEYYLLMFNSFKCTEEYRTISGDTLPKFSDKEEYNAWGTTCDFYNLIYNQ